MNLVKLGHTTDQNRAYFTTANSSTSIKVILPQQDIPA